MSLDFVKLEPDGLLKVEVDLKAYTLNALLKTAYWFTDRCFLHLQFAGPDTVEVRFKCKPGAEVSQLPEQFMNELLDQALRDRVSRESEAFKNLILAHAFSKTCLIHPEREAQDPFEDPLKISQPDDAKESKI